MKLEFYFDTVRNSNRARAREREGAKFKKCIYGGYNNKNEHNSKKKTHSTNQHILNTFRAKRTERNSIEQQTTTKA